MTASFADVDNDGDQDLFVTTVRGGNVALRERRPRALPGRHAARPGVDARRPLLRGGLLRLRQGRPARPARVQRRPRTRATRRGRTARTAGSRTPSPATCTRAGPSTRALYRNLGRHPVQGREPRTLRPASPTAGAATPASPTSTATAGRTSTCSTCRATTTTTRTPGARASSRRPPQYFPKTPWGAMGIKFFDYDNDGLVDLFVTDMHSDMSEEIGPEREKLKSRMRWPADFLQGGASNVFGNALLPQPGRRHASRRSRTASAPRTTGPGASSVGDLNADGWDDAFITSGMGYPFRYGVNTLLLNDRGAKFVDAEFLLGRRAAAGRPHPHALVRPGLRDGGPGRPRGVPPCRGRDTITRDDDALQPRPRSCSTSTTTATSTSSPTSSTTSPWCW